MYKLAHAAFHALRLLSVHRYAADDTTRMMRITSKVARMNADLEELCF